MNIYRRPLITMGVGLALMVLAVGSVAHDEEAQTTYSGSATALNIDVNVPPVVGGNVNLAKTQEYQDAETFDETQQHGGQMVGPFPDPMNNMLSGGARQFVAMTEGGTLTPDVATSMAVISDLRDLQLSADTTTDPLLKVNADVILSNTRAECIPSDPSVAVSGGSLIGKLDIEFNGMSVTGGPVSVAPAPNTTIAEVPGLLRVIANEQLVTADSIEVIALHIIVENPNPFVSTPLYDVKLARSKSDISSCPPRMVPKAGERMEGKGAVRWPDGSEVYFCYWCAISAEGDVSGNLYLFDNSENGVEVQNWWNVTAFTNPDGSTTFPLTRRCTFEDSNVTANATNVTTQEVCVVTGTDSGATDGSGESVTLDCESYDADGPLEYGDVEITQGTQ